MVEFHKYPIVQFVQVVLEMQI